MARPIRIQYAGAQYHITSRGNGGQKIFKNEQDYKKFLEILREVLREYNWISYTYCLMPNHYHLFIKTIDPNLSEGMKQLNGKYSQKFNIKYKRYGHVFQSRYKAILVERLKYEGRLIRYITLNPVKARLVKRPEDWKWSSYGEIMGKRKPTECVHINKALSFFDKDKSRARRAYKNYIHEKMEADPVWEDLQGGVILGSERFIEKIKNYLGVKRSREIIKKERYVDRPSLVEIFNDKKMSRDRRDKMINRAFFKYGYTQVEISDYLDMHYSTVSRIITKYRNMKKK